METEKLLQELTFKAVRSSGAGGQNVNKVSSKIVLSFNVAESHAFTEEEKNLALQNLASKLNKENILILHCDEDRSQLRNKDICIKRFLRLIQQSLTIQKERKKTKIPKSVIKKRLQEKKRLSEKKQSRRKDDFN